jgi:hypothetical protein
MFHKKRFIQSVINTPSSLAEIKPTSVFSQKRSHRLRRPLLKCPHRSDTQQTLAASCQKRVGISKHAKTSFHNMQKRRTEGKRVRSSYSQPAEINQA